MGSKVSKAVRPHREAAASPAATASEGGNETGSFDDPAARLPVKLARDDIYTTIRTTTATPHRRNSAPATPTPSATSTSIDPSLEAATMSELRTYYWNSRATELATMAPLPPSQPPRSYTSNLQTPAEPPPVQCLACCKSLPKETDADYAKEVTKPCSNCNNAYCVACVRDMFVKACTDTSCMPPRCCKQIHLHQARRYLSAEEVTTFKLKYEEWSTRSPLYCPAPTCSTFIPERLLPTRVRVKGKRVDSGVGTPTSLIFPCQVCATDICLDCRQMAHPGSMCAIAEFGIDAETSALLKSWGYKKCPKCGHGLKRMYGCNQMQCRCSAQFCWVCLGGEDECDGGCYDEEDEDCDDEEDHASEAESPTVEGSHSNNDDVDLDAQSSATDSHDAQGSLPAAINNTVSAELPDILLSTNQNDDPVIEASVKSTDTAQPAIRARNLDGGSHRYWEEQDLNFGDEPSGYNQDRSWNCDHTFTTHEINLETALSNDSSTAEMECTKCWHPIHPGIIAPVASKQSQRTPTVIPRRHDASGHPIRRAIRRLTRWDLGARGALLHERTAETSTASPLLLSQSVPAREPSPMEDVQFTGQVLDTYGNIVSKTASELPRRASLDNSSSTGKEPGISGIFASSPLTFSLAFECRDCGLLVCQECRDACLLSAKKMEEEVETEIHTIQSVEDIMDSDGSSDCGF
ncbi:hypothetical protein T440DRAFT_468792 [Plenodomus tracheiphilus IPT5]|uniref:RBR-type E3 ubiquitin transferase n=1 Tax=Plenodomus tracheiphilus IPT5 TaxID=1408161 RepID=A0A6A7B739_9PLEO|nr:hypothetical protein T440DRAFT_468792 [Plenodomus tracheiphilus IPT5]